MKKSINWINAETSKPPLNKADRFDAENGRSIRVLVWVKKEKRPAFATFASKGDYNKWTTEGFMGDGFIVSHFAIINDPEQ